MHIRRGTTRPYMNGELLRVEHDEIGIFLDIQLNVNVAGERPFGQINIFVVNGVSTMTTQTNRIRDRDDTLW